jgi:prolyl 4-hydroxylase
MFDINSYSISPQLEVAKKFDDLGRHDDALVTLANAAKSGDLPCMTEMANRVLVGRHAPHLPSEGIKLLNEAAARNEPKALERLAALSAGGACVTQNWKLAFELLVRAAECGGLSAQHQLLAITSTTAPIQSWRELASSITVEPWLEPITGNKLSADGRVVSFPNLIPLPVCTWLMQRSHQRLKRARVYDSVSGHETTNDMRSNSAAEFDLSSVDVVQFLIQLRMSAACGISCTNMESPTILHYAVGERIREHFDYVDPNSPSYLQQLREQGQRVITFLLYLNDEYSGGETDFPTLKIRNKGKAGEGLYFVNAFGNGQPDKDMLHAGLPPSSGEKWIVSQFIRSVAVRQIIST